MKILRRDWLQVIVLAVPFIVGALVWNRLPARMPIHWGITGQPDGYADKSMSLLFLPCISIGVWALILVLPRFDPKVATYDEDTKASLQRTFAAIRLAMALFFSVMSVGVLLTPLCPAIQVPVIACSGVGVLLMVLGNLMSKLRPNWFCGIRTPWTLESREVWARTHRLGGRLMMACGGLIFVFGLLLPMKLLLLLILLPAIAVISIVPLVYSYVIGRKPAK
ncbi:MAG: SdpI family protein [Limisphaerales bacterium]